MCLQKINQQNNVTIQIQSDLNCSGVIRHCHKAEVLIQIDCIDGPMYNTRELYVVTGSGWSDCQFKRKSWCIGIQRLIFKILACRYNQPNNKKYMFKTFEYF